MASVTGRVRANPVPSIKAGGNVTVIELFTSEGCWSCPPAEDRLALLADEPDVIALAYHVDYWDYIGWPDPFADPMFTSRQRHYALHLGSRTIYTPQMVFQGSTHKPGTRDAVIKSELRKVSRLEKIPVNLSIDTGGQLVIDLPATPEAQSAEILLATYDRHQTSEVARGENAGKTLNHRNVVRQLMSVAEWNGKAATLQTTLPSKRTSESMGCAVLVQARPTGRIFGAAAVEPI